MKEPQAGCFSQSVRSLVYFEKYRAVTVLVLSHHWIELEQEGDKLSGNSSVDLQVDGRVQICGLHVKGMKGKLPIICNSEEQRDGFDSNAEKRGA